MQEQDLKEYYRTIFTLKTGQQIEILTEVPYREVLKEDELGIKCSISMDDGFIARPLLIAKSIEFAKKEVIMIESTLEPHVPWRNTELDIRIIKCDHHPVDMICPKCQSLKLDTDEEGQ